MDAKLIELAAEIAAGTTTIKYVALGLIACVMFVGLYVRSRVGGYATKLGEIAAETSKIEDIKVQLAATTRVTEEIRSEFSQKDWRERERMTLMRTKLEEALTAAHQLSESIGQLMTTYLDGVMTTTPDVARNRLSTLVDLYFDNLRSAADRLVLFSFQVSSHVIAISGSWRLYEHATNSGLNDGGAAKKAFDEANEIHNTPKNEAYKRMLSELAEFERQAAVEMKRFLP